MPVWEEVQPEDVVVLKDIMASRREANDVPLQYNRIPITAEKPPDYSDLKEMIEVVLRNPPNTPIVVNCQLGRGRSTLATVRPAFIPLTKGTLTMKHPSLDSLGSHSRMATSASTHDANVTSSHFPLAVHVDDPCRAGDSTSTTFVSSDQ